MNTNFCKAVILGAGLVFMDSGIGYGSVTFGWNGGASTLTTASTSGSDPNISAGSLSQGNGFGSVTLLSTTSASSGYTGASGNGNFANGAKGGDLVMGVNGSAYYAVTLTPGSGYQIIINSISLGERSTSTGPTTLGIFTSIDNYTTAISTISSVSTAGTWALFNPSVSGSLVGAANTSVTFEIFGYGGK